MSGLEMHQPAERSGGFRVLAIAAAGAGLLLLARRWPREGDHCRA